MATAGTAAAGTAAAGSAAAVAAALAPSVLSPAVFSVFYNSNQANRRASDIKAKMDIHIQSLDKFRKNIFQLKTRCNSINNILKTIIDSKYVVTNKEAFDINTKKFEYNKYIDKNTNRVRRVNTKNVKKLLDEGKTIARAQSTIFTLGIPGLVASFKSNINFKMYQQKYFEHLDDWIETVKAQEIISNQHDLLLDKLDTFDKRHERIENSYDPVILDIKDPKISKSDVALAVVGSGPIGVISVYAPAYSSIRTVQKLEILGNILEDLFTALRNIRIVQNHILRIDTQNLEMLTLLVKNGKLKENMKGGYLDSKILREKLKNVGDYRYLEKTSRSDKIKDEADVLDYSANTAVSTFFTPSHIWETFGKNRKVEYIVDTITKITDYYHNQLEVHLWDIVKCSIVTNQYLNTIIKHIKENNK